MNGITIYLPEGTYNGVVTMNSTSSSVSTIRVSKDSVRQYEMDLDGPGIYFLLVGDNEVYVGQSGLESIVKRIQNTHSGTIDSSWHTVVGFKIINSNISTNELLYIENAMCEYVRENYDCLTTTPTAANCNRRFRTTHYKLSIAQIHSCDRYIEDIKYYISTFPNGIFSRSQTPSIVPPTVATNVFYFSSPCRDTDGVAEIAINLGHAKARKTRLKKGSKISKEVSDSLSNHDAILAKRQEYEMEGKIINRILQEDIEFDSQSGAGAFLNGTSFDGNSNWKTRDGKKLKELL